MALIDLKSNLSTAFKKAPVNVFPDATSGATGFTENFTDSKNSQYTGIKGNQYTYPTGVNGVHKNSVMEVATANTKFDFGIAKLSNQLGNGSPFHFLKSGGAKSVKKFSVVGYNASRTYGDVASKGSILKLRATEQNSPSALDEEYKKFSLRDDAYNTTYMNHPLIVRGIQRKGNEKPQYWGFGSKAGFDDGLIRGGVVTVADRIVADTVRIAKWMASPKGLLWVVKQIGLGLTNPKVEAVGGPFTRQTRIHSGIASLLSVPGTALGLHFTRHGLPFLNETASYGKVLELKQLVNDIKNAGPYSRLIELNREFANGPYGLYSNKLLDSLKILKTKSLGSSLLSGLAGSNSVYGIGVTQIRRVVDTRTDAVKNALKNGWENVYLENNQYASTISKAPEKTSTYSVGYKDTPFDDRGEISSVIVTTEDRLNQKRVNLKNKIVDKQGDPVTPFNSKITDTDKLTGKVNVKYEPYDLSTSEARKKLYTGAQTDGINSYMTLAYNTLKSKSSATKKDLKGDFRNAFKDDKVGYTGYNKNSDYEKNSLEAKYGFGELGKVGADRTDPNKFLVPSSKFSGESTKEKRFQLHNVKDKPFRGDFITAIDINTDNKAVKVGEVYPDGIGDLIEFYFEDGDIGYNVMPFRATLTGLSDSFSPGWNRIDIMGRPDGAYLYTSFERSLSFSFTVAALSRSEMIPMWRKLNYLATYTMPDFNSGGSRPSGPFMRLTIGDMFNNCPGFLESLTYTIPDEATWDIAADKATGNKDAKQLPMMVEVSVTFKVVHDQRPQLMGRAYYLAPQGNPNSIKTEGSWLADAEAEKESTKKNKSKAPKKEAKVVKKAEPADAGAEQIAGEGNNGANNQGVA